MNRYAVLVMHYGTPRSLDEVLPYYTHIRRGRPPDAESLRELTERYRAIGGPSPLNELSRRQAEAIVAAMGPDVSLYVAAKHVPPFLADVVAQMARDGVWRAAGVVLAPHYSRMSVGAYAATVEEARARVAPEMRISVLERWGEAPELVDAIARRVRETARGLPPQETLVLFTAHSLPSSILATGDPYPDELRRTSELVAEAARLQRWRFAYQSAGRTADAWLGPDVLEVIQEAAGKGFQAVVAAPIGFVSDHLEVLYDLDVEAKARCESLGMEFRRAPCVNVDPKVMAALGARAQALLDEAAPVAENLSHPLRRPFR